MNKSLLRGGAATAVAFLSVSLFFYTQTSIAEPLASTIQGPPPPPQKSVAAAADLQAEITNGADPFGFLGADAAGDLTTGAGPTNAPSVKSTQAAAAQSPAQYFTATAYSLRGRTASGRNVARGIIAADRKVLPLGTRVRLDAGPYSGEYLVADTGGLVRGRKIDIWVPNTGEALRFGRRPVKLTVLTYGGRRSTQPRSFVRR